MVAQVVPFLGHSAVQPWGASRRWNAWVEFHVGGQLVASSALGHFALIGGRITEDISRPIRRDAQVSLMFPTGLTRITSTVYTVVDDDDGATWNDLTEEWNSTTATWGSGPTAGGTDWNDTTGTWDSTTTTWDSGLVSAPFDVGSSEVGGEDTVGAALMLTTDVPPVDWDGEVDWDASADWDGLGIFVPHPSTPPLVVSTPAQIATTTRSVFVPTNVGDLLDPNGPTVMKVWAGFYGEEVLMGTFDLSSVPVRVTSGGAALDVAGHSFERRIAKAGFWEVEAAPTGANVALAAASLVLTALPSTTITSVVSNTTIADLTWKPGDDRLAKINALLATGGLEGRFTRDNIYTITSAPSLGDLGNQEPEWSVLDGINARIATLNSATRDFSDEDSYNGVVIEGDSHDSVNSAPIIYTLWNTNPSSPLFYDPANPAGSLTGPRPKYVRSELVRTAEDAVAVAQAELTKVLMISDSIEAEVPANASIEMGHFARVASEGLGLDGVYRITRVVHDLTGGPASLNLYRFQQV